MILRDLVKNHLRAVGKRMHKNVNRAKILLHRFSHFLSKKTKEGKISTTKNTTQFKYYILYFTEYFTNATFQVIAGAI